MGGAPMTHVLRILDEGNRRLGYKIEHNKRPYCECGWLGALVKWDSPGDPPSANQQAREQFYAHLGTLVVNRA